MTFMMGAMYSKGGRSIMVVPFYSEEGTIVTHCADA
jgi:acyl-CoA hydrolase